MTTTIPHPSLSCRHPWQNWNRLHAVPSTSTTEQHCPECGATCERDPRGKIVRYDRPAPGMSQVAYVSRDRRAS